MSIAYQAVGWNRQKKIYDLVLLVCVFAYLVLFLGLQALLQPYITIEAALLRGTGTAAILLLHLILCIGPLARLDRRFLPLLYNRRHMGVTMFLLGLVHGLIALALFHGLSDLNPLVSLFVSDTDYGNIHRFPFQVAGFAALMILFIMAATSHDFWLANLTAPVWKALHMLVYLAWFLLIAHILLGVLQAETSPILLILTALGILLVLSLHLLAAFREQGRDRERRAEDFVDVGCLNDIPEKRALVVTLSGERVAVFKYDGKVSAVSNVCRHQNGPLGEGKIVDGCITCPWHGYQYLPHNGASPPPFTEKVPTFKVLLKGKRILVHPKPYPAGTAQEPALIKAPDQTPPQDDPFYVGYLPQAPVGISRWLRPRIIAFSSLALVAAVLMIVAQNGFSAAQFEFGTTRSFEGLLLEKPYPALLVKRPGLSFSEPASSYWHLVGEGKHGIGPQIMGMEGKKVKVRGTLIYRDNQTMLEVIDRGIESLGKGDPGPTTESLGRIELDGEIVDSKCFLGVMKPGNLETHRACAIRCIDGGIPPVLVVRNNQGFARYFLLSNRNALDFGQDINPLIARPLRVSGDLKRRGDQLILETSLGEITPY